MSANVVILSREGLSELIATQKIAAGTDVDLARVPLGVAVRAGASKPDVSTVEAFKQLLLKAKSVAVPGSTSGIWLKTELFPQLGIADKINIKVSPRGSGATDMVAAGDADLAVMPVSEIVHAPGVDLAGNIAPEIQFVQTFSAAIVAGSGDIENSKRLIEFLLPRALPKRLGIAVWSHSRPRDRQLATKRAAGTVQLGFVRFSRTAFGKRDHRFDECIDRSVRHYDPAVILSVAGLSDKQTMSVAEHRGL